MLAQTPTFTGGGGGGGGAWKPSGGGAYALIVSATFMHPPTEMRLPKFAQTSALATPDGCITAYMSGTAVSAKTAIPAAVQDRVQSFIAIPFPSPLSLIDGPVSELRAAVYSSAFAMRPQSAQPIAFGERLS